MWSLVQLQFDSWGVGVENQFFLLEEVRSAPNIDGVIPKASLYRVMVVWFLSTVPVAVPISIKLAVQMANNTSSFADFGEDNTALGRFWYWNNTVFN